MFYLRIIEETRENENDPFEQVIENFALGNAYSILRKGATQEFEDEMKTNYPETNLDELRALICGENGLRVFITNETKLNRYDYFVMTENGKTFERL